MSEFLTQHVETTIAGSATTTILSAANGDFDEIADPLRTLVLPCGSLHTTAGLGWQSGTFDVAWRAEYMSADLADDNTLTFQRGFAAVTTSRCGLKLIKYVGPAGGPNEFIRRSKQVVTLAAGQTQIDSTAITGVTSFAKLFAQVFIRSDLNSNDARHIAVRISPINTGGTYTIRLNRSASSGTITADLYVYEMIGANWAPQWFTKTLTATSGDTTTITSAAIANTFLLRTFSEAQTTGGPINMSPLVWQSAATTLAYRCPAINSTIVNTWVLTNPSMTVQQVSTPDGTDDWAAGTGNAEQTQTFSFTNPVDLTRSIVLGQAGSADTTANNHGSEQWLFKFTGATTGTARRGRSFGATEHVLQAIQFPQDTPTITGVSATLRTGGSVVLDGTKFKPDGTTVPTVTMRGSFDSAALNVTASSDIQVTADVAIGTQIFEVKEFIVTTSIGSASITQLVQPPAGETYFNLSGGIAESGELTALPALAETAQIWGKLLKDSAAVTVDITDPANFLGLPSGVLEIDDAILVPATVQVRANNNNGTGWPASFTTITIDTFTAPPVVGVIPPMTFVNGVLAQFDLSIYATGEDTVGLIGSLPPSFTMPSPNGFVLGTPLITGDFILTASFTNLGGTVNSAPFVITVIGLPTILGAPPDLFFPSSVGSYTVDFSIYFSGATSYSMSPAAPLGWELLGSVLTIDQSTIEDPPVSYIVTGTNAAGSASLAPFIVALLTTNQIAFTTASRTVNERSSMTVVVNFRNRLTHVGVTPKTVSYRIDSGGQSILGWTPVTPAAQIALTVTPEQTTIHNSARLFERRTLTVAADYGLDTQFIQSLSFQVRNRPY